MPIRVMHVVDHLGKGGLENGLVNLINGLDSCRFEHVVYAMRALGPNAARLPKDRTAILCQGKRDSDSRFQIGALVRAIRSLQPHVVHSRNWAGIEAVVAAKWVRSVATIHSEHGLEGDANAVEPLRRRCFRRIAYELADRVLSVSHTLKQHHAERTGFRAARITVIHNGVDSRRFYPDPEARARMRAALGLAENEFFIGCVGNLLPVKDHLPVLQAVRSLACRLVILGEGPERPKLEAFLDSHPALKRRVSLPGTSDRIPEFLNAMDAYVLSSLSEGISNSLLEAMSCGLPVIATDTGGNPEVVVDGKSGLLFPVGDSHSLTAALERLRNDAARRQELGREAIRRVREEFSIEAMVRKYDEIYEDLGRGDAETRRSSLISSASPRLRVKSEVPR